MDVLIVGGSRFVGRHIANALIAGGATVALFNRGNAYGPPIEGAAFVRGDRTRDFGRTGDRVWDAVIDTCAYTPVDAEIAARYFAARTKRYVFISTISVYDNARAGSIDEDSPVQTLPAGAGRAKMTPETYGALKAMGERIVRSTFRERALIVRPGLVAGPYDPTDRFTYWPLRIAQGGDVLLPDSPQHPIQYIDARDLGAFVASALYARRSGTYNVVTTPGLSFGDVFAGAGRGSGARAVYVPEALLLERAIEPWSDLPLWIPSDSPDIAVVRASNTRALRAGLQLRPPAQTMRDVLAWAHESGKRREKLRAGLSAERERGALHAAVK